MLIPAIFYICWDIFFTAKGIWSFNDDYIIGIKFFDLPLEEILFFFIVPYCCVFIYECVRIYFPQIKNIKFADEILKSIGIILLLIAVVFYNRWYTSWTFTFTAIFIASIYLFKKYFSAFNASIFLASYLVMLIPFFIVNGFLTSIPVVIYNNAENLGVRLFSIPIEDTFYGMLLILMNIVIYEKLKSKKVQP
jgi:lycopene cyclase domain-containing protein